jgi:hypothetical protein
MTNHEADNAGGAVNGTLTAGRVYIRPAQGYWNGGIFTYWDEPNHVASNYLAGKTHFGLAGTIPINPGLISGCNHIQSAQYTIGSYSPDGINRLYMRAGIGAARQLLDGDVWITTQIPDLLAANFLATKNILGVTGDIPVAPNYPGNNTGIQMDVYNYLPNSVHNVFINVPRGYYNGVWLGMNIPGINSANIRSGVTVGTGVVITGSAPNITNSAATPSGGYDGDYWIQP